MSRKMPVPFLKQLKKIFIQLRSPSDLADLLDMPIQGLKSIADHPKYYTFHVLKKNGKKRLIEDPNDPLQDIQAILNNYLQAIYWLQRSEGAYGFIIVPKGDDHPRNIENNARQHLRQGWLLNADLEDFFHKVTRKQVLDLWQVAPFNFPRDLAVLLMQLTTYHGRLPMGAPTSPVLSNLAFQKIDKLLNQHARKKGWRYTRFVDDMSFSSKEPITWNHYGPLQRMLEKAGFPFNPAKAKIFGPYDEKQVTGLVLGLEDIEVPATFYAELSKDIKKLKNAIEVQYRSGVTYSKANERFQQSVAGKLQFANRIMGMNHPAVKKMRQAYLASLEPPEHFEVRSWLDFSYF